MSPRPGSSLMTLGSAAVVAVYAAGYARTKPAADLIASMSAVRRVPPADRESQGATGAAKGATTEASTVSVTNDTGAASVHTQAIASSATRVDAIVADTMPATAARPDSAKSTTLPAMSAAPVSATTSTVSSLPSAPPVVALAAPIVAAPVVEKAVEMPVSAPPVAAPVPSSVPVPAPAAPAAASPPAPAKATTRYRDGMFLGRGTSRHGDIEALVEVQNGRIVSAIISQCLTRYSCSWIADLPPQVPVRQSPDVDNVSGATESANAFYYAVVQALKQAK